MNDPGAVLKYIGVGGMVSLRLARKLRRHKRACYCVAASLRQGAANAQDDNLIVRWKPILTSKSVTLGWVPAELSNYGR
jgi:hypothetical protein